jgi:tetratricopeptide (TPR) repeat protein
LRPNYPEAHVALGCALARQEKYAEAAAQFRAALRLRPEYPQAHNLLGSALYEQQKYTEAEAEHREALRLRPDYPEAHCELGNLLASQWKYAEAEAEHRKAFRLRPDDPRVVKCLGLALRWQGRPAAAARFCAEALAGAPKLAGDPGTGNRYNAACFAALAGCGRHDGAKLDEAERARLRRQALDWLRADLAAWGQRLEKEQEEVPVVQQRMREWEQDADFAGVRGEGLAKLPEAERQAWQQLWADVEALRVLPDDPKARVKLASALATAYERSPQPERSLAILTDLIASAPEDPHLDGLLWGRGEVALRLGRWKEAEADFMKAIERSSDKHYGRFLTASVCLLAGDEEGYRRLCHAMLAECARRRQEDPQSGSGTSKVCLILPVAGADLASAVRFAKEAMDHQPDNPWNLVSQGMADCRTGAYAAAVERLNQAIKRNALWVKVDSLDAIAHLFLAMAHQGQGHADEAKRHLDAGRRLVLEEARGLGKRGFTSPWWDWTTAFAVYPQAVSRVEGTPESKARAQLDAEIETGRHPEAEALLKSAAPGDKPKTLPQEKEKRK